MGFNDFMLNNFINPVAGAVSTAANATVPVVINAMNPVITPVAQGMSAAVTGTEKLLYGDAGMSDRDLDAHQANDAYVMSKIQHQLHKGEDIPYKVVTNPKVLLDAEDFVPVVGCAHRISNIVEDAQQNKSATDDGVNAGIDCVADAAAVVTFGAGEALKGTKAAALMSTAVPGTRELVKVGAKERLVPHMVWNGVMGVGINNHTYCRRTQSRPVCHLSHTTQSQTCRKAMMHRRLWVLGESSVRRLQWKTSSCMFIKALICVILLWCLTMTKIKA